LLLLFLGYGWGQASVLEAFTHCCSDVFKVNVHFVQVFSLSCSLMFINECAMTRQFVSIALVGGLWRRVRKRRPVGTIVAIQQTVAEHYDQLQHPEQDK
jgi:hypothetical protein